MLPLELVKEVVSMFVLEEKELQSSLNLHKTTKGYLLPLLLTDKTFYAATLSHLYEHVRTADLQNPLFVRTITEEPRHGSLVKHCAWSIEMTLYERADGGLYPSPSKHRQVLDDVLSLLKCFQNLKSLSITYGLTYKSSEVPADTVTEEPTSFFPTTEQLQAISFSHLESLRITDNSKYTAARPYLASHFHKALEKTKSAREWSEALSPWPLLHWFRTACRIKSLALEKFDFRDSAVMKKRGWKGLERVIIHQPKCTSNEEHLLAVFLQPLKELKHLIFNFTTDQNVGYEFLCQAFLMDVAMAQLTTLRLVDVLPFPDEVPEPFAKMFPLVTDFTLIQTYFQWDLVEFIKSLFPDDVPCPRLERMNWSIFERYPGFRFRGAPPIRSLLQSFTGATRHGRLFRAFASRREERQMDGSRGGCYEGLSSIVTKRDWDDNIRFPLLGTRYGFLTLWTPQQRRPVDRNATMAFKEARDWGNGSSIRCT